MVSSIKSDNIARLTVQQAAKRFDVLQRYRQALPDFLQRGFPNQLFYSDPVRTVSVLLQRVQNVDDVM